MGRFPNRIMSDYFYGLDGQQHGPASEAALLDMWSSGQISREAVVWKEGMPEWVPAERALALEAAPPALPRKPPALPAPGGPGPKGRNVLKDLGVRLSNVAELPTLSDVPIRDILEYGGAKFLCPMAGTISMMPGTGSDPAYRRIDVDTETGKVSGLF